MPKSVVTRHSTIARSPKTGPPRKHRIKRVIVRDACPVRTGPPVRQLWMVMLGGTTW